MGMQCEGDKLGRALRHVAENQIRQNTAHITTLISQPSLLKKDCCIWQASRYVWHIALRFSSCSDNWSWEEGYHFVTQQSSFQ